MNATTLFGKESVCRLTRDEIHTRVEQILSDMTLKEKVLLLNGNWDLVRNALKYKNPYNPVPIRTNGSRKHGVAPVAFTDGPRGVVMGKSTCFPVSMARGASFDPDLEYRIGEAIGREARAQGANLFAGVCINLLRHPAWGRAQETYGEDPLLVGSMGAALTRAVQHHNVMACPKHYALNNIENSRFFVDVQTDDRTLHEVYLPHFRMCIEAGAASVMGAYNKFRGDHLCESSYLLTDVLRGQWGFEGFTISDFIYGVRDTKKAIEAGLDIEMPMPIHYQKKLEAAVRNGIVDVSLVTQAARRVLFTQLVFENSPDPETYEASVVATETHIALAREAAEKSMVLLKNEQCLPLERDIKKLLVVGALAAKENTGDHGSSRVYAPYVVTPLEGLRVFLGETCEIVHCTEDELEQARTAASDVDAVLFVVGNDYNDEGEYVVPQETEGEHPLVTGARNQGNPLKLLLIKSMIKKLGATYTSDDGKPVGGDRDSLSLCEQQIRAIQEIAPLARRSVVSLVGGSAITVSEWVESVDAVLMSWYSGMEGGAALARVVFGEVNPSGKLPFSVPVEQKDLPYFSSADEQFAYDRYHGYTWFEKNEIKPAYPFGFGLSYTRFDVSKIAADRQVDTVEVSATIRNTGVRDGAEVLQVYVALPDSKVERAPQQLVGFTKVSVSAGQSADVHLEIPLERLAVYDPQTATWAIESGTYHLLIGASSDRDNLTTVKIKIAEEIQV